jgi:hypothetical protein
MAGAVDVTLFGKIVGRWVWQVQVQLETEVQARGSQRPSLHAPSCLHDACEADLPGQQSVYMGTLLRHIISV